MKTKEIIDRIFKEPGIHFELSEFENLVKPIHEIIDNYPKTNCTGAFYVCSSNDIRYREVILLFLRCVRSVFEKYYGGSSYPTIEIKYFYDFPVPSFNLYFARKMTAFTVQDKNHLN